MCILRVGKMKNTFGHPRPINASHRPVCFKFNFMMIFDFLWFISKTPELSSEVYSATLKTAECTRPPASHHLSSETWLVWINTFFDCFFSLHHSFSLFSGHVSCEKYFSAACTGPPTSHHASLFYIIWMFIHTLLNLRFNLFDLIWTWFFCFLILCLCKKRFVKGATRVPSPLPRDLFCLNSIPYFFGHFFVFILGTRAV